MTPIPAATPRSTEMPAITAAITDLYASADLASSRHSGIVPLARLIEGRNLVCRELPNLTGRAAMEYLMAHGGLIAPSEGMTADPLAGFLYGGPQFGSIFVEQGDLLVRRRFSVAHELGHYLLHFQPLQAAGADDSAGVEMLDTIPSAGTDEEDQWQEPPIGQVKITLLDGRSLALPPFAQMEAEANAFAGALLMPVETVRALARRYARLFQGEDLVWRMAGDLLVSRAAMRWRLRELRMLSRAV